MEYSSNSTLKKVDNVVVLKLLSKYVVKQTPAYKGMTMHEGPHYDITEAVCATDIFLEPRPKSPLESIYYVNKTSMYVLDEPYKIDADVLSDSL